MRDDIQKWAANERSLFSEDVPLETEIIVGKRKRKEEEGPEKKVKEEKAKLEKVKAEKIKEAKIKEEKVEAESKKEKPRRLEKLSKASESMGDDKASAGMDVEQSEDAGPVTPGGARKGIVYSSGSEAEGEKAGAKPRVKRVQVEKRVASERSPASSESESESASTESEAEISATKGGRKAKRALETSSESRSSGSDTEKRPAKKIKPKKVCVALVHVLCERNVALRYVGFLCCEIVAMVGGL